jgi:hypothetical protein
MGFVNVRDKDGKTFRINKTDPRYNIDVFPLAKGKVSVKNKEGKRFSVSKDDPRYLSKELIFIHKGKVVVRDKDGNTFQTDVSDKRYISGELIHAYKNHGTKRKQKHSFTNPAINKPITLIYENNKRFYFIENYCKHGDLKISQYIFKKIKNNFYCENCLN